MFINFQRIPDRVFFKCRLTRDIQKAIVSKYSDIAKGKSEVELVSPLGFKKDITKQELIKNYVLFNNKKIKMLGVRCGTPITVVGTGYMDMFATYIPTNCSVEFDDMDSSISGKYIVCESTMQGTPNKAKYYIVSKKLFQKIFVMQGDINSLLGNKPVGDIDKDADYDNDLYADEDNVNIKTNLNKTPFKPVYQPNKVSTQVSMGINLNKNQNAQNSLIEEPKKNKYCVVSKVVNSERKLIALKLKDKKTGNIEKVSITFIPTYVQEDGIDGIAIEYTDGNPVIRYKGV
jgi:hypothetical protein